MFGDREVVSSIDRCSMQFRRSDLNMWEGFELMSLFDSLITRQEEKKGNERNVKKNHKISESVYIKRDF